LQHAARDGRCRLIYLDEAGFAASAPVQRGWSPIGQPHVSEPQPHCRRSVLGALDYGANTLMHQVHCASVKRDTVVQFVDQIAQAGEPGKPTIVVLDNAKIHHGINEKTLHRWLVEHSLLLLYLPAYSPELNLIEIIWKQAKYHWRRFVTWTKETIDDEIAALLGGYGSKFEISFS
jgi:transposase